MNPLNPLDLHWERDLIDQIDGLILSMLRRRLEHSQHLQHRKAAIGMAAHDPDRERVIIAWYDRNLPDGGAIAKAILDSCRSRLTEPGSVQPPTSKDLPMDPHGGFATPPHED